MIIRVRERTRVPNADERMFYELPHGTSLYAYGLSIWLHTICVAVSILIAGLIPPVEPPERVYRAKALIIRLPKTEHVPEAKPERETEPAEDKAVTLRKLADQLVMALRENNVQPAMAPGAALKQPPRPAEAVLIQPQFPLEMQPPPMSPMVPSVLLWSTELPAAPEEQVKLRGRAPGKIALLERPLPNTVARLINRDLPAPPIIEQNGEPTQPVALLSISSAPMVRDTIVVPPGNLIPSGGPTADRPVSEVPGDVDAPKPMPRRTMPDRTTPSKVTPESATASNAPAAARPATPPVPFAGKKEETRLPNTAVVAGTVGVADGPAGTRNIEPAVRTVPAVPADRLEHPVNGLFDVVIVQSTLDDSVPGSGNLLHGRPIYTVYLQVGDSKDWILHYCVKDGAVVQRGAVFQLPDPRPVKAPYPRYTYRPAEPLIGPAAYILVHGLIDEAGALQNLKVVGPIESGGSSLLAALGRWRFRPATRGEAPEPVEMVLAIPIRKT